MNQADQVFWDRIDGMPAWEAEQECVTRRESASLESSMLHRELAKARAAGNKRQSTPS